MSRFGDTDNERERQDEIRDEIGRLAGELARLRNPDDQPILMGWAIAYEWTSVDLEQNDRFGIGTTSAREQLGAATRGLFEMGSDAYFNGGDA